MRSLCGTNAQAVIARLNPIIRGWSAYYRAVVSSEAFTALDHYLWKLTYKWARYSHPNKPTWWDEHPLWLLGVPVGLSSAARSRSCNGADT